jgi:hypothetical protein
MLHLQPPLAGCWGEPVGAADYSRFLVLLSAFGCSSQLRRNQGKNCQSGAGAWGAPMMRAIAIAATVVMCAACAGQDQQSDGVGAPKATPVGFVDMLNKEINAALADPKPTLAAQGTDANVAGGPQPVTIARGTNANAVGDPQPATTAQGTDTNAVGDPQPVPNTLCARIAARATNFELQCSE